MSFSISAKIQNLANLRIFWRKVVFGIQKMHSNIFIVAKKFRTNHLILSVLLFLYTYTLFAKIFVTFASNFAKMRKRTSSSTLIMIAQIFRKSTALLVKTKRKDEVR
jgi:hypothetical protein